MAAPNLATLYQLSDMNAALADPAEDVRGRKVVDSNGEEIGKVDDLMVDEADKKIRFLRVAAGGVLGLGKTKFLLPVDVITRVTPDTVHIDRTHEHVAAAPAYDPKVVDQHYIGSVYDFYGYEPYWGPGYRYPGYPYYP